MVVREIYRQLFRGQINIRKDRRTDDRLFQHLTAPTGKFTGIQHFSQLVSEFFQHANGVLEMPARTIVRVVINVGPTDADRILPLFLQAPRRTAPHPVIPLGLEPQIAGPMRAEIGDGSLIGIGAVVLNGAKIGRGCLVGAGALVTEGKEFPDHSMIIGSPAKAVKTITPDQARRMAFGADVYAQRSRSYRSDLQKIG